MNRCSSFAAPTHTTRKSTQQRQSRLKWWGRMIVKLSCLGTLACLLAYLVMDPNQLEFTQTCGSDLSHSHQVSQLPHHIIPETTNFSRPCDSQHGAMAFFEVPLMVAVITLSIPILPLIQYCVGTAILSYYTNTMMCEGTFNLLAVLEWSQLQVYCTCT